MKTQASLFLLSFFVTIFVAGFAAASPSAPETKLLAKASEKKVRVLYYNYPPHMILTKNGLTGATYDVWNRVAKRAGVDIEWVGPIPFARAQHMLEIGEADAIMRMVKTPERAGRFIYTDKAPIWGKQGIAVLKSSGAQDLKKPEDLKGKSIGMISGGVLPDFLENNRRLFTVEPIPIDTVSLNMKKLFRGRIWGVYFVFTDVAKYYASREHRLADTKFVSYPGSQGFMKAYMALSKKAEPELVAKLVKAINQESETYDYEKISEKYIEMAAKGLIDEIDTP